MNSNMIMLWMSSECFQFQSIPSNNEEIVDGNCVMCVLLVIHINFFFFLNCWLFACPHVRALEGGEYKKSQIRILL
jgi:hypothetical protein